MQYKISWFTGTSIVIANMIGVGVFTTIGYQLKSITHTYVLLLLWILGGLFSLAGALSYAEVGTVIRKSGGEFTFLSNLFHPMIGFLSGWVSLSVGFAAPIALSAIGVAEYSSLPFSDKVVGLAIIIIVSLIHSFNLKVSSLFQVVSTGLKVALIVGFVIYGFLSPGTDVNAISTDGSISTIIFSSAFIISFIYVTYAYSGWNAAAYIIEEFKNPVRDFPKSLLIGTTIVMVLYCLVQYVILKHAPIQELMGKVEVGAIAASYMMEIKVAHIFNNLVSLLLISSISAMIWVGPRVTQKITEKYRIFSFLEEGNVLVPKKGIWLQAVISIILLLTGTFEQILVYSGILLTLSSLLVVCGVFVLRRRKPHVHQFKSPLYPLPQIFFIPISILMLAFGLFEKPFESVLGIITLLLGTLTYFINKNWYHPTRIH